MLRPFCTHARWRRGDPRQALSPEMEDGSGLSCRGLEQAHAPSRPNHLLPRDPEQVTSPLGTSVSLSLRWG